MEEQRSLFRQKSIQSIESPENLNQYLHVTSPGVWTLLVTVIILLIGVCIWGIFGHMESTRTVGVVVNSDGKAFCLVSEEDLNAVIEYPQITIDGNSYPLEPNRAKRVLITEDTNLYVLRAGDLTPGGIAYEIPLTDTMPDTVYAGSIITERITPVSLLMNTGE